MEPLFRGIDVSSYQGVIDWEKVKASGVQFAIIRCGYGDNVPSQDDPFFARNRDACEAVGMPYGVYLYSYATSAEHADSEAQHVIRMLDGHKPQYPVYYDLEDRGTVGKLSDQGILDVAQTFNRRMAEARLYTGFYANKYWWVTKLNNPWFNDYPRWVAMYAAVNTYPGTYGMWQYSNQGSVPGINGRALLDYAYVDYSTVVQAYYDGVTLPAPEPTPEPQDILYTVKPGDTLWAIGIDHGTTWQALAEYNHLSNPRLIFPGQIIRIPQK